MKNLLTGLLLAVLGGAVLLATASFPTGVPAAGDPALLPRISGVGLVLAGLVMTITAVLALRAGAVVDDDAEGIPIDLPVDVPDDLLHDPEAGGRTDWVQVLSVSAAVVVYAVVAFRLGFVVSTVAFVIGAGLLLGRGRHPRAMVGLVVFALALAAAAYVGFFVLLDVRVPDTLLP